MFTKPILTAAAIALVAGVGSAAADEFSGSSGGFTAFHTLAEVQAMPLDTDEMASVTAKTWYAVSWKDPNKWREIKDGSNIWSDEDTGLKLYGYGKGAMWLEGTNTNPYTGITYPIP